MSKKLLQVKPFSRKDFDEAPLLDRIYMNMMDDNLILSSSEQSLLEELEQVFVLICEEKVPSKQVTKVMNFFNWSRRKTLGRINQCETIFGQIRKINRDFMRQVEIDRMQHLIDKLEKMGKYDLVIKARKILYDLIDFSIIEETQNILDELQIHTPVYTTDYSAYEDAHEEE